MSVVTVLFSLLALVNGTYALYLLSDLRRHWPTLKAEPAPSLWLAAASGGIFFLSAFGISDFALASTLYRYKRWVGDRQLPGTLNTQCVLPVAVMAFAFIALIEVEFVTLVACILAQAAGAYTGPRLLARLSTEAIRRALGLGMLMAMFFIVASKLHWVPAGGEAYGLSSGKLAIACVCLFAYGALNNLGIGSYPLTMVTVYALGLNPAVAFPVMMGASAFSVPIGSMQVIKRGQYSRKLTLYASVFGVAGVLAGVFLIKTLDVSLLQWLVAAILCYSGLTMLRAGSEQKA